MNNNIPQNLKYVPTHQWVKMEEGIATIGITDFAQRRFGPITRVELASPDENVEKGDNLATIESGNAVSDITSPLSGKIVKVNNLLKNNPGLCNSDPYGRGWLAKVKTEMLLDTLMTPEEYADVYNDEFGRI